MDVGGLEIIFDELISLRLQLESCNNGINGFHVKCYGLQLKGARALRADRQCATVQCMK
ncbi:MAG: hypothetical protein ACE5KZ_13600 [Candidatus Scalinduaceae bacterium]